MVYGQLCRRYVVLSTSELYGRRMAVVVEITLVRCLIGFSAMQIVKVSRRHAWEFSPVRQAHFSTMLDKLMDFQLCPHIHVIVRSYL
jgi:hypothetical protein